MKKRLVANSSDKPIFSTRDVVELSMRLSEDKEKKESDKPNFSKRDGAEFCVTVWTLLKSSQDKNSQKGSQIPTHSKEHTSLAEENLITCTEANRLLFQIQCPTQ